MKTFMMFFFLVSGQWYPGWFFDGWAPAEMTDEGEKPSIVKCLERKTQYDSEMASHPGPYEFPGVRGEVSRVHVKCIQVVFPKVG